MVQACQMPWSKCARERERERELFHELLFDQRNKLERTGVTFSKQELRVSVCVWCVCV